MDSFTVIVMLAIHLIAGGGLLFLVWRLMPDAPGLSRWWLSGVLFGLAYLLRLTSNLESIDLGSMAADCLMLLSILLMTDGIRTFVGRAALAVPATACLCIVLFAVEVVGTLLAGPKGRHVTLDVEIAALYGFAGITIAAEIKGQHSSLRPPLRLLTFFMTTLSSFVIVRAITIAMSGVSVVYTGIVAKVFYMYAALAAALIPLTLLWMLFLSMNKRLADLAQCDPLTGILNRAGLSDAVAKHFVGGHAIPLIAILIDIDYFKRINDAYGHDVGDAVLVTVAKALKAEIRGDDFIARVGGEEFLVGVSDTSFDSARLLAERLNRVVSQLRIPVGETSEPIGCTVSIGLSGLCRNQSSWDNAYKQADKSLYLAKASGRNSVHSLRPVGLRQAD